MSSPGLKPRSFDSGIAASSVSGRPPSSSPSSASATSSSSASSTRSGSSFAVSSSSASSSSSADALSSSTSSSSSISSSSSSLRSSRGSSSSSSSSSSPPLGMASSSSSSSLEAELPLLEVAASSAPLQNAEGLRNSPSKCLASATIPCATSFESPTISSSGTMIAFLSLDLLLDLRLFLPAGGSGFATPKVYERLRPSWFCAQLIDKSVG
mmetsp:Transcript_13884/g.26960  ORF Transcript_13884/g.26960 Transcript_13884/m.26960 type:complete len:211 (-) Transcript_13884:1815-2447(-)